MSELEARKERPIPFNDLMVRAILDGRKTQTRRVVRPQPGGEQQSLPIWSRGIAAACGDNNPDPARVQVHSDMLVGRVFPFTDEAGRLYSPKCPYGIPGDYLWVKENFYADTFMCEMVGCLGYAADGDHPPGVAYRKMSSRFMPRRYARIILRITSIGVEHLQDISEEDAKAEGALSKLHFHNIWDSIYGKKLPWESNPFVWVIGFERVE
jgi:hypothetical protein